MLGCERGTLLCARKFARTCRYRILSTLESCNSAFLGAVAPIYGSFAFLRHHPSNPPNFTTRNCCTSKSISVCLLLFCHRLLLYNSTVQYTLRSVGRPSSSSSPIWYVCASQHARNPRLYNGALLMLLVSLLRFASHVPALREIRCLKPTGFAFFSPCLVPHAKLKKKLHKPDSSEKNNTVISPRLLITCNFTSLLHFSFLGPNFCGWLAKWFTFRGVGR